MHIQESGSDEKHKKRRVITEKCNRISSLHDSILHHILSFLPTIIAVRTFSLSKRWQKLWISLPYIHLEEYRKTHMESFMNFVDNFLLHRDKSSKIVRFRLSVEYFSDFPRIDTWISAAVRTGVEELDLYHRPSSAMGQIRTLTSSCLFCCNSLVALKLDLGNRIRFPKYFCFPKMKKMHLSRIIFPENFIHMLEFNSPNLEKLFLELCSVDINSPPSSHTFQDLISEDHILGKFTHLNDVYLGFYFHDHYKSGRDKIVGYYVAKFIRRLYNVQALRLPKTCIKLLTLESHLLDHLPTFCNLKRLELCLNTTVDHLRVMASLRRCSPFLESLHIVLMLSLESELMTPKEFSCLCPPNLKWIRMDNFLATNNQVELVRLFLTSSQFLEKLIVQVDGEVIDPISLGQELLKLPRLSTNCVLQVLELSEFECLPLLI